MLNILNRAVKHTKQGISNASSIALLQLLVKNMERIRIILASISPRRQEMLQELGIPHELYTPDVTEEWEPESDPSFVARDLAVRKAKSCPDNEAMVIAMDTLVAFRKKKLGKPIDASEARSMLRLLSGKTHRVITGVALRMGMRLVSDIEITRVTFRKLSETEIDWYISTGEPMGKAGAYGIQGKGRLFVDRINGCFYNVVGFPVSCFQRLLHQLDHDRLSFLLQDVSADSRPSS